MPVNPRQPGQGRAPNQRAPMQNQSQRPQPGYRKAQAPQARPGAIQRARAAMQNSPAGRAMMARMNEARAKASAPPPQISSITPPVVPKASTPVAPVTPARPSAISATSIRQLMLSRASAMRTIYVLSEVVNRPLALRDDR
jgi:hypothetical protein